MFDLPSYTRSLQLDVRDLRINNALLIRSIGGHRKKSGRLQEENERLRKENNNLRKERDGFIKEINGLKEEIEKLTKTNSRYQIALFDHDNFKHPDSSEKKPKGGQVGHTDTNRESHENYKQYERKRLFLIHCTSCGKKLKRVDSIREKILMDVVINPQILKYILSSERQWCKTCKKETNAKHTQSLPFTEYGINTFMVILVLRFKVHCSFSTVSKLLTTFFGLTITESVIVNILFQAKNYLKGKYDKLIKEVRKGEVVYNDETGWLVRGKGAWMWIAANEKGETVYFAAESRGGGIAKEMYGNSNAYSMHDGYKGYTGIPYEKNLFCWSHMLRFSFEETVNSPPTSDAVKLRDKLVGIFHLKKDNPGWHKDKLEKELTIQMEDILKMNSKEESFRNIKKRLIVQKDGLIRALLLTPDGTNNLAERELRPLVIGRKVSYGSDTYTGMETSAVLASIVRTIERRTKEEKLLPTLQKWLIQGVKKKYPNYAYY